MSYLTFVSFIIRFSKASTRLNIVNQGLQHRECRMINKKIYSQAGYEQP